MTVKNQLPNFPLIESPMFVEHYNQGAFGSYIAVARNLHNRGYAVINIFNSSPDGMAKIDKANQEIYYEYWDSAIKSIDSEREVFLAKKGQSLMWTANLIHGGMPVVNRELTRKSIVTHYYFEDCYYYTPMLSDVRKGNIFFRDPKRVARK